MRSLTTVLWGGVFVLLSGCGSSDSPDVLDDTEDSNLPSGSPASVVSNFDLGTVDGWAVTLAEPAEVSTDGMCGFVQVAPDLADNAGHRRCFTGIALIGSASKTS